MSYERLYEGKLILPHLEREMKGRNVSFSPWEDCVMQTRAWDHIIRYLNRRLACCQLHQLKIWLPSFLNHQFGHFPQILVWQSSLFLSKIFFINSRIAFQLIMNRFIGRTWTFINASNPSYLVNIHRVKVWVRTPWYFYLSIL